MSAARGVALSLLGSRLPALADWLSDAPEEVAGELVALVGLVKQEARAKECEAIVRDLPDPERAPAILRGAARKLHADAVVFLRDRAAHIRRGEL